jgi:vitamin B12 transporter
MKKPKKKQTWTFFYLVVMAMILVPGNSNMLFPEIIETVEVKGQIFSNEAGSKNMIIVTAEDLENLKITDTSALFSFLSGVQISRRGPGETSYDISMRGSNFEQVLVLVNGVPLSNPQTGHFNCDFPFSIEDIERIELIRGGTSTTYGSGAFAGMIHIILKKKKDLRFSASTGEHRFSSTRLQAGKAFKNTGLHLSVDKSKSSGFHEGREFDQLKLNAGGFYSKGNTEVDLYAGYLQKDFGAQGFYAPYPSYEEIKSYLYQFQFRQTYKNFKYSVTYSNNLHKDYFLLDRNQSDFFSNNSDTTLQHLNFSAAYQGKRIISSAGIEFKRETMNSSGMGDHKRNRGAIFLNLNYITNRKGGIDLGIRRNILSGGNSTFTYYSGIYQRFGEGFLIKVGYGKSFRIPSFTELYYQSPANIGNTLLKPEICHNLETCFSLLKGAHQFDLSLFYRKQRNILDWIRYPGNSLWLAKNIDTNDILGVELTHRFQLARTYIDWAVERLTATEKQTGFESKYGLRFPDFSFKFNLVQPIGKTFNIAVHYTYKRIYETTEKGHFMDVVIGVPLGKFEINLRADNVFNTIIEELPGLKIPGRWIYLSIQYN